MSTTAAILFVGALLTLALWLANRAVKAHAIRTGDELAKLTGPLGDPAAIAARFRQIAADPNVKLAVRYAASRLAPEYDMKARKAE